jgi:hypothetical protein
MWPIIKKAVNSDLSTPLNVLIDSVKTIANTSKTVIDAIDTNVGSNADAASATGSLHAKIKEIRSYLGGEVLKAQHPRSIKRIEWTVNNTELTNVLYVTGKGELLVLVHVHPNQNGDQGLYRIVLDEIEIFNGSTGFGGTLISQESSDNYGKVFSPDLAITTHSYYSSISAPWGKLGTIGGLNLPFSSSLLIQCAKGVGSNRVTGVALYSLE